MSNRLTREMAESGFLNARQAAAFLGCSKSRIYELKDAGTLSYADNGGVIVFPRKALIEYAASKIKIGAVA